MLLYSSPTAPVLLAPATMYSYVMPVNTFADNGDILVIQVGYNTNTITALTFQITFGGVVVATNAEVTTGCFRVSIIRTGSATQTFGGVNVATGLVDENVNMTMGAAAIDLSNPVTISATVTAMAGGGNVTGSLFSVTLFQG